MSNYFQELSQALGRGWNRFWFLPSDALTLCVVRVLVGLLVLYTLATYTPDLDELFGPGAWMSAETVAQYRQAYAFSFFDYLREPLELRLAHGLSLFIVALFVAGVFARVTAVLSLVVFLSYLHRAPLVTAEYEPVLVMALAYLCLGRCGSYLSFDAWRSKRRTDAPVALAKLTAPSWTTTVASRLMQVHLALIFALMATAKLRGEVWWNGDAVWWLLARPESRLVDLTRTLDAHPYIYHAWTYAILAYELSFPVLIWNRWARPLLLGAGLVLWPLLALITGLVSLAATMLAVSCVFISPAAMRGGLARLGVRV